MGRGSLDDTEREEIAAVLADEARSSRVERARMLLGCRFPGVADELDVGDVVDRFLLLVVQELRTGSEKVQIYSSQEHLLRQALVMRNVRKEIHGLYDLDLVDDTSVSTPPQRQAEVPLHLTNHFMNKAAAQIKLPSGSVIKRKKLSTLQLTERARPIAREAVYREGLLGLDAEFQSDRISWGPTPARYALLWRSRDQIVVEYAKIRTSFNQTLRECLYNYNIFYGLYDLEAPGGAEHIAVTWSLAVTHPDWPGSRQESVTDL